MTHSSCLGSACDYSYQNPLLCHEYSYYRCISNDIGAHGYVVEEPNSIRKERTQLVVEEPNNIQYVCQQLVVEEPNNIQYVPILALCQRDKRLKGQW